MRHLPDVVCFSHLRYDFVFQRPNHLMSRCARDRRVFYVEERENTAGPPEISISPVDHQLWKVVPRLPAEWSAEEMERVVPQMLERALRSHGVEAPILWFYTPMALPLARGFTPTLVVYDCMDELSGFWGASPLLEARERALFAVADLVFTGGQSLYHAKRRHHSSVHVFPSSVDAKHFARARNVIEDPSDQRTLGRPRVGFFGVIDERMDLELLASVADERPRIQFVMVGPVVKIDPGALPQRPNIHYLGKKSYDDLPHYLAGWDAAMMPFALNESTQYISPTKTLEYLAAHKPVVSTAITDVVYPYGEMGAVRIAGRSDFAKALDEAMQIDRRELGALADSILRETSWDATWSAMTLLMTTTAVAGSQARLDKTTWSKRCSTI